MITREDSQWCLRTIVLDINRMPSSRLKNALSISLKTSKKTRSRKVERKGLLRSNWSNILD